MAFLDPTRFHVAATADADAGAHAPPTFHEAMADQLQHAPWLGLSVLLHALVVLLVWLWPQQHAVTGQVAIAVQPPPPVDDLPEVVEPSEPVQPETTEDDLELIDPLITEPSDAADVADAMETDTHNDPVDTESWTTAVGLGPIAPGKYRNRPGGRRGRGGRPPHAPAIDAALGWLRDHQDDDGRWDADEFMKHDHDGTPCSGAGNPVHDVGVTGLALLAFLGDGNTLRAGEHKDVVKRAVRWLLDQQDPETGRIGATSSNEFVYGHAIATLALVEAYGLSRYRVLRDDAQRAIDYLEWHRNPYGAWRYQPRDGDQDVSVTGWCILAYKAAQDFDLAVNRTALELAATFLDQMTDPATGRTGYAQRGGRSSRRVGEHAARFPREHGECMTAVSLLCRVLLGQAPDEHPILRSQADLITSRLPAWDEPGGHIDHYAWYYATYALWQFGGEHWRTWSRALTPALVRTQRQDGNEKGSWDPVGAWGTDGGRVYSTAILALTLQGYYRYTRVLVR